MATAAQFVLFAALPTELRLRIWTEVLTEGSVWVAASAERLPNDGGTASANRRPFHFTNVGTSPHLVGQSCHEARRLMKHIYGQPFQGLGSVAATHWIYVENTVLIIDDALDPLWVLDSFSAEALARFHHIALVWQTWGPLARACMRLAASCPRLQTLIIRRMWPDSSISPVDVMTAAQLAALRHEESLLDDEEIDTDYLRQQLLQYFADPLPRLHLVGASRLTSGS
jgi:hypothetical protein